MFFEQCRSSIPPSVQPKHSRALFPLHLDLERLSYNATAFCAHLFCVDLPPFGRLFFCFVAAIVGRRTALANFANGKSQAITLSQSQNVVLRLVDEEARMEIFSLEALPSMEKTICSFRLLMDANSAYHFCRNFWCGKLGIFSSSSRDRTCDR